jgi:hypothetical protein
MTAMPSPAPALRPLEPHTHRKESLKRPAQHWPSTENGKPDSSGYQVIYVAKNIPESDERIYII